MSGIGLRVVRWHVTVGRLSLMWHGPELDLDDVLDDLDAGSATERTARTTTGE